MIYIKSIVLNNFQKHKDLSINFDKSVNIIAGQSQSGKSCLRRAIEWVLFASNIDSARRQGSKQTSVKIILNNDYEIERTKSQTINRYTLRKGDQETVFNACGKTVPEEIQKIVGISPIVLNEDNIYLNSAKQITLPFLFDISASERGKLFNRLTGNDMLDTLLINFNKEILSNSKELKREEESLLKLKLDIEVKEQEKNDLERRYVVVSKFLKDLKETYLKYSKLLELKELYQNINNSLSDINNDLKGCKVIDINDLQQYITTYDRLKTLLNASISNDLELVRVSYDLGAIKVISSDFAGSMGHFIDRLVGLKVITDKLEINTYSLTKVNKEFSCLKTADLEDLSNIIFRYKAVKEQNIKLLSLNKELEDLTKEERNVIIAIEELKKEQKRFQVCDKCAGVGVLYDI